MNITQTAFNQFCQYNHLPQTSAEILTTDRDLRRNFFNFLEKNPLKVDVQEMFSELVQLTQKNDDKMTDLALAKIVKKIFPEKGVEKGQESLIARVMRFSSNIFQKEDDLSASKFLGTLDPKLLSEHPSTLLMIARRLPTGHAYLFYLEAGKPVPQEIEEKLNDNLRQAVEAAHQYNQNPTTVDSSLMIRNVELKNAAPYLRSLVVLSKEIHSLPNNMSLVNKLNCSGCTALTSLPTEMPNLESLSCSKCPSLTSIPENLKNLRELICNHCHNMLSLPEDMPHLEELTCFNCTRLFSLPKNMESLQLLNCAHCNRVDSLPKEMPSLKFLDCTACSLTSFPGNMSSLEELYCQGCETLASLPSTLSHLRTLDCDNCKELTSLPANMFNLKELSCNNCKNLRSFPEDTFHLETLNSQGCPNLILPKIYSDPRYLDVNIATLADFPEKVLLDLQRILNIGGGFFPKIWLMENDGSRSEGVDIGGVSRHVFSSLMANLVEKDFPFFCISKDTGNIPRSMEPEQNRYFNALGEVFSSVYQNNDKDLVLGSLFDITFFRAITSLEAKDFSLPMTSLCYAKVYCAFESPFFESNPLASALNKILKGALLEDSDQSLTEKELETLHYCLYFDEEGSPLENCPEKLTLEQLRTMGSNKLMQDVFERQISKDENGVLKQEMEAAFTISYAMFNKVSDQWDALCLNGADALCIKLQGILTDYHQVLNQISYNVMSSAEGYDGVKTERYFKKWMEQADSEKLTKFVKFLTGSPTLTETTKLLVNLTSPDNPNTLPDVHSCINAINLPTGYETQEIFNKKLELAMEEGLAGSGFQVI